MNPLSRIDSVYTPSQVPHVLSLDRKRRPARLFRLLCATLLALSACVAPAHAQSTDTSTATPRPQTPEALEQRIDKLEAEIQELKSMVKQLRPDSTSAAPQILPVAQTIASTDQTNVIHSEDPKQDPKEDRKNLDFLRDTTINLSLDTYYAYNFNHPIGRVNLLRAYDVLSNEFSLNQASLILEHAPNPDAGRRWGGRLDLQFGQATDTLQGNPSNEPRPEIYRNIFQAYGTYVIPVDKGITVDFGKWASSLGIEGNYTKDQFNYSRAFWFAFLPFYHMGLRANVPVTERLSFNYWVINGTNQVEATNGFKDQLFGFTGKPTSNINWTFNYYLGQEHPDRVAAANCGPIPVQPGLCFTAISPAPNGRTHIFDGYVSWKAAPKLTLALEGDYVIQRLWQNAAPGDSSAPSHTDGGAAYIQYQLTPWLALAGRAEYMSDRGGLFSGISQALKENTVTFDYKVSDGLLMRYEWRRDFSNQPSFLSDVQGVLSKQQNTATLGIVWWWGRKEGSW